MMQIIHTLDDLCAALEQGATEMHTAESAVSYLGAGYMHEMIEAAKARFAAHDFTLWCDCGDDTGAVMEAVHTGLTHIMFSGAPEVAAQMQAFVEGHAITIRNHTLFTQENA